MVQHIKAYRKRINDSTAEPRGQCNLLHLALHLRLDLPACTLKACCVAYEDC